MSGTLFVVATPIGNLEDITIRAVRVLGEVDVIAAEDTRRTARLLSHYGISTPTLSFHQHNSRARLAPLVERLRAGGRVAVVTDAGTPGVSDPGLELVQACVELGIRVEPVAGVSAPLAAGIGAGFSLVPFTILGFVPNKGAPRTTWFEQSAAIPHTFSFFEAPHRIQPTLRLGIDHFGKRPIVVGRELTKVHEEFIRGTCATVLERLSEPRGEFTVIVGPVDVGQVTEQTPADPATVVREYELAAAGGAASRRDAIAEVATRLHLPRKTVYSLIEAHKKLAEHQN